MNIAWTDETEEEIRRLVVARQNERFYEMNRARMQARAEARALHKGILIATPIGAAMWFGIYLIVTAIF